MAQPREIHIPNKKPSLRRTNHTEPPAQLAVVLAVVCVALVTFHALEYRGVTDERC
jgi:hypothetical protein